MASEAVCLEGHGAHNSGGSPIPIGLPWMPDEKCLRDIVYVLSSANTADNAVQQQVAQAFHRMYELPDLACYLAYILFLYNQQRLCASPHSAQNNPNALCSNAQNNSLSSNNISSNNTSNNISNGLNNANLPLSVSSELCQVACLTLKTYLCNTATNQLSTAVYTYVQPILMAAIEDPEKGIRHAASSALNSLITIRRRVAQNDVGNKELALRGIIESEVTLITHLLALIDSARPEVIDGAFITLNKVIEDSLQYDPCSVYQGQSGGSKQPGDGKLESPQRETLPDVFADIFIKISAEKVIPKLLEICEMPIYAANIKHGALASLALYSNAHGFAPFGVFNQFFDRYWVILGCLATEQDLDIRRDVAQGIILVLEHRPDAIHKNAEAAIAFMLSCTEDADYKLRLDTLEFWPALLREATYSANAYGEDEQNVLSILRRNLAPLLRVLIRNTVYHEWDYLIMDPSQLDDDNAAIADESYTIEPRFHRTKGSDDDEDESDDNRGTWGDGWTVRKGSALTLDHLAAVFRDDILPEALPIIESQLYSPQWEVRESAVLTLGAVAQGCHAGLAPYLPKVLEYLLKLCDDPKPLIRSISCWCISRYASWICSQSVGDALLKQVLQQVLRRVLDRNKRVQEAACSAFATIEEEARFLLTPYLPDIISTINQAFNFYQAKNLLILYDAVGTLADSVGTALADPTYSSSLLKKLFLHWDSTPNANDPSLISLFECLTCCASAMKQQFMPYAKPVAERCVLLISQSLKSIEDYEQGFSTERPSRDILECSMDLLSGLCEGLDDQMPLILEQPSVSQLLPLLLRSCSDTSPSVLQSSLALVGDLAKNCSSFLVPGLPTLFPLITEHLLHGATSVSNNAGWASGELAIRLGPELVEPYVDKLSQQLVRIITRPDLHRSLLQNVCVTLGRVGLVCPVKVAVYLREFIHPWCLIMRSARNDQEKATAFEGMCRLVEVNPDDCADSLFDLLLCILTFQPSPPELENKFTILLQALKQRYPEKWMRLFQQSSETEASFPPPMQQQLVMRFGVLLS